MTNFAIDSLRKLREKTDVIQLLSEAKFAKSLIVKFDKIINVKEKLNKFYKELNCEIKSIEENVIFI